jgi:DNA-binding transcriptional LysR family regulator
VNDLGIDLELRLVRYFIAVADHGNFSRAAAELHLAQPALSRQIQRLEHRVGTRLFERTPSGAALTAAGAAFLPEAHALLRAARRAALTVRAHAAVGKLIVGYVEDLVVTPAIRELRDRHPGAEIGARHLECNEQRALLDGTVDVLVARAPLMTPTAEVKVIELYDEPRVLVVPAGHPLAARAVVSPDDFAGEQFICPHGGARAIYPAADHQPVEPGPVSSAPNDESFEDRMELVASGQAVALLPIGDRRATLRPDLVTVAVEGVPASTVVVATRAADPNPMLTEFLDAARTNLRPVAAAVR